MSRRPALAISLYVADRRAVVVGTDEVAAERAARLREAGAEVALLAPEHADAAALAGAFLVFACDAASADRVTAAARAAGALAYALDRPELSDFAMPALARRAPLSIALSTDGAAPALAARLRAELERLLDAAGPDLDALIAELETLRERQPPGPQRRAAAAAVAARAAFTGGIAVAASVEPEKK